MCESLLTDTTVQPYTYIDFRYICIGIYLPTQKNISIWISQMHIYWQYYQTSASITEAADLILYFYLIPSINTNQSSGAAAILPKAPPPPGHGLWVLGALPNGLCGLQDCPADRHQCAGSTRQRQQVLAFTSWLSWEATEDRKTWALKHRPEWVLTFIFTFLPCLDSNTKPAFVCRLYWNVSHSNDCEYHVFCTEKESKDQSVVTISSFFCCWIFSSIFLI